MVLIHLSEPLETLRWLAIHFAPDKSFQVAVQDPYHVTLKAVPIKTLLLKPYLNKRCSSNYCPIVVHTSEHHQLVVLPRASATFTNMYLPFMPSAKIASP